MPLPPWSEVWEVLRFLIAPALGASLFVMIVVRFLVGERFSVVAPAMALVAGVFAGNYFHKDLAWRIEKDRPLNDRDLRTVLGWSLEGKPPEKTSDIDQERQQDQEQEKDEPASVQAKYWLPWLAGLALLVDLLARLLPISPGCCWSARTLVAVLAGRLLTPANLRIEVPWASWALSLSILLEWAIVYSLARRWKDGSVAAVLSICFTAAVAIILRASYPSMTNLAMLFSVVLFPIALIAWFRPSDTGAALSAAVVFLPGMLLITKYESYSQIPWRSFQLAALAPFALLPMLLPALARQTRWRRWVPALMLPAIPATWAVILAAEAEKLPF